MKALKYSVAAIVILLTLVVLFAVWIVKTEAGLAWSVKQLSNFTDAAIEIESPGGTWNRGVSLARVYYDSASGTLELQNVALSIRLRPLMKREFIFESLSADTIAYAPKSAEPRETREATSLPVRIVVREARVGELELRVDEPVITSNISFSGDWGGDTMRVERMAGIFRDVSVSARGTVKFSRVPEFDIEAEWQTELADRDLVLAGAGRVNGALRDLEITHTLTEPENVTTHGRARLDAEPFVELSSKADRVVLDLDDRTGTFIGSTIDVIGWIDNFRFAIAGDVQVDDLPPFRASGNGTGGGDALRFERLELVPENGRVIARGDVTFGEQPDWQFDVELEAFDPALLLPKWPGRLDGQFVFKGGLGDQSLSLAVSDARIVGMLRDYPIKLIGAGRRDGSAAIFENLSIESGTNRIEIDGRVGNNLAFSYRVDAESLGFLGPEVAGRLKGNGRVGGTVEAPEVDVNLRGNKLRFRGYAIENFIANGGLLPGRVQTNLDIEAIGVQAGDQSINKITGQIAGSLDQHRVELNADREDMSVSIRLDGGLANNAWSGFMSNGTIQQKVVGTWQQRERAALNASAGEFQLSTLCLRKEDATACAEGGISDGRLDVVVTIEDFDLGTLSGLLPGGSQAEGLASATARVTGNPRAPGVAIETRAPAIAVRYTGLDETVATTLRDINVNGVLDGNSVTAKLSLGGDYDSIFSLEGRVVDWNSRDARLDVDVNADVPDLGFIAALYPGLAATAGELKANLSIAGTARAPSVEGGIELIEGRAELRRTGITVERIQASVRAVGPDALAIKASALSGDGELRFEGGASLDWAAEWPVRGNLTGDRFVAIDRPDVQLVVSPDLSVSADARRIRVTGRVDAPRAIVTLHELPTQAVRLSRDVVVVGESESQQRKRGGIDTSLDVTVRLGDEVRFNGYGLTTDLGGSLALTYSSEKALAGNGTIDIESGVYRAYGQELEITNGRLVFSGPIDDPVLDVTAARRIDDIEAGVRLTGTGKAPQATVFSSPAMPEGDALSYMLTGRPLARITSAESNALRQSAIGLGVQQTAAITDQLGQAVGLDELSLDTDEVETGAIMAGKQITPDVYVRYTYGLFTRIGALLFRYRINDRLSLEARSSIEEQAMDLIYTRGRE